MNKVSKLIEETIKEFYNHQNNDYIGGNGSEHDYGVYGVYNPLDSGYGGVDTNNYTNNELDANKDKNSIADIVEEKNLNVFNEINDIVGSWGKDFNLNGDDIHGGYTVMNTNPDLNKFNNGFKYMDSDMGDYFNGLNNQERTDITNQDNYNNYTPQNDLFNIIDEEIQHGYFKYDYDGIDLDVNTEKIYNSHNNQNNDNNFKLNNYI